MSCANGSCVSEDLVRVPGAAFGVEFDESLDYFRYFGAVASVR